MSPVLATVLVLVGCSSTSSGSKSSTSTPGDQEAVTTSIVIGPDGSSTVVSDGGGAAAPDQASSVASSTDGSPAGLDASGPPGSFASALLGTRSAATIAVEVRAQSDAEPRQESVEHVSSVLRDVSGKSVDIGSGAAIAGSGKSWSADELRTLAGPATQSATRAVVHLLFVHGTLGGDNSVLGVALRGDTAAVFVDRVNAAATPLVGSSGIEVAVVTHELGHLLGLVDLFLHTGRQDPEHPGHSTNKGSVMYWAVESDLVANLLQGGPPRDFDSEDMADLETIHNSG